VCETHYLVSEWELALRNTNLNDQLFLKKFNGIEKNLRGAVLEKAQSETWLHVSLPQVSRYRAARQSGCQCRH